MTNQVERVQNAGGDIMGAAQDTLTMSSGEIAELCDKQHKNVKRDIVNMLNGLELNALSFERIYRDARNREQTEYRLPKDLTLTLVAGYNVQLRKRIIDRWLELEENLPVQAALTGPQLMAAALIEADATIKAQAVQIEGMREDVEAHHRIAKADGSFCVTDAAKALQMRPKDLFSYLSQQGWTYKRPGNSHWLGYQAKVVAGLLEHKVTTVLRADGSEKVTEQVRITPKGLSKLAILIKPVAA